IVGAVHAVDDDQAVQNIQTMEQVVETSLFQSRFSLILLTVFAGLAVVLAAVGIYGVISYSVSQRVREIGVRMALGARRSDVLKAIVAEGMMITGIGVAIGLVSSFALTRVLSSLLYGVSATDLPTFGAVSVALGMVALVACYIPAHKATKVDPVTALRCE
ncbi:MAG: FtsX-like permease family protein, partial [Blastocatellia bacterium]